MGVLRLVDIQNDTQIRFLQMCAGGGAGIITKTSIAPLERIKIIFQIQGVKLKARITQASQYEYGTSISGAARKIFREEGIRGFWKGNGANVMRVVPVYALKFMFFDTFKDMFKREGQNRSQLSFSQLVLAGTTAGLCQISLTYPLDLIRTRLALAATFGVQYNGIRDCIQQTFRQEGFLAFYKGFPPTIVSGSPYIGFQMTFFEVFKRITPDPDELMWKLVAGAGAGLAAQTLTFPGDTVRRRMQANGANGAKKLYSSSWDCTMKIIQREGFIGLFRGWSTNALRCLPGAGIQFASYDTLKHLFGVSDMQLKASRRD